MKSRAWTGPALLACALLAIHVAFDGFFSGLRGKTFDLYQLLAPAPALTTPVVIVAIDDESLRKLGRWPWNRGILARLVDAVAASGASAIGLDILLPERDLGENGPEGDLQLARSLASAPTILPASIGGVPSAGTAAPKAGWALVGDIPPNLPAMTGIVASDPLFNRAAQGLGIIRAAPDPDGILRKMPLAWVEASPEGTRIWPALALELVRVHLALDGFAVRMSRGGFDALRLGDRTIPLTPTGSIILRERKGSPPILSAASLIDGPADSRLKDAIAIIAVAAVGLDQYHSTPARVARLGAEVHALAIEQILTGELPAEPRLAAMMERLWFAAGAIGILLLGAGFARRPYSAIAGMGLIVLSPLAAGFAMFATRSLLLEGLQPASALLLVAMAAGYANYRHAERKRTMLQRQFAQFLSPEIVARLARSDAEALIAVEKRLVSVLIMDLRGFTAMTRNLSAAEIVQTVNHFLGIATEEILARNGTIDKFMGDAVLAIWNAPVETPAHADLALAAAEAIIDRIAGENPRLAARKLPELAVGAGLETGICSVGNFGTTRRIDYTAIGEAINLASRLESATKETGIPLLAGPGFRNATSRSLRPAGSLRLQGFSESIDAFTLPRLARQRQVDSGRFVPSGGDTAR